MIKSKSALFCFVFLALFCSVPALAAMPFGQTEFLWMSNRDSAGYSEYAQKFAQDISARNLDTKDGCYRLGHGDLTIDLVVDKNGVIDSIVTQDPDARSECFRKVYQGLKMQKPPFSPLVIHMLLPDRIN